MVVGGMKYNCYASVTGSKYLGDVEADTIEEAIDKAWQLKGCHVSFCHHCADQCEDPQIEIINAEEAT